MKKLLWAICLNLLALNALGQQAGVIVVAFGEVKKNLTDYPKVQQSLKRGSKVEIGDIIITGENSRATIKLLDQGTIELGSSTQFVIEDFQTELKEENQAIFDLAKGAFRMVTGSITTDPVKEFTVKTPLASIGIRGTEFWGGYLTDENEIDVLFIDGTKSILVSNAFGETLLETPGQGTTIKANQKPQKSVIWPKEKVQRAVDTIKALDGTKN